MHAQELSQLITRLSGSNRARILTRDEELEAALAWKNNGDEAARRLIVETHVKLVIKEVRRMRHYRSNPADLASEGMIGLTKALDKFDPDAGFRFSTYATYWIRAKMNEYILETEGIMRISNSGKQKRMLFGYRKAMLEISRKFRREGQPISHVELQAKVAEALNVTVEEVRQFETAFGTANSLDAPTTSTTEGQPQTLADILPDDSPIAEDVLYESQRMARMKDEIAAAMELLDPREKTIIMTRKFAADEDIRTLEELSQIYKISRERVRQVEVAALKKLKLSLASTRELLETA